MNDVMNPGRLSPMRRKVLTELAIGVVMLLLFVWCAVLSLRGCVWSVAAGVVCCAMSCSFLEDADRLNRKMRR